MSDFNPYREWLGIESTSKPTYYQLLGISPSEEDVDKIRRCALVQLNRLQESKTSHPSHQPLKQKMSLRIKRAAKCLMNDELRIQYDRKLLSNQQETPKPIDVANDDAAAVTPDGITINAESKKQTSVSRRYKSKQQRNNSLLLCLAMGLISIGGLAFLLGTQTKLGRSILGIADGNNPAAADATANFEDDVEPLPMDSEDFPNTDLDAGDSESPDPHSDPSVLPMTVSTETASAAPQENAPTKDELEELESTLKAALHALQDRDPEMAQEKLSAISKLPMRPDDRSKYDRLVVLADYVEQYWQALADALASLKAGTEISMSGNRMILVEINRNERVVRSRGQNKTLQRDNLPLEFELALADGWFDNDAASTKVFRGAMMAVTPGFDADEARKLWHQAKREGANIGDLESVLDDDYNLGSASP